MKNTIDQHTPKISNPNKAKKYLGIVVVAIIVIVLAQGFFTQSKPPVPKNSEPPVNVADTNAAPLNLNVTVAPTSKPLPTLQSLPPAPPPPSILSPVRINLTPGIPNDDSRLRSPTQIYGFDNSSTSTQPVLPGGSDANSGFAQQAANAAVVTVSAKQDTQMDYKILQGKFISAALETSINSDMPGMARAVVSKDIYSDTGKFILLPRGTRLIGMYNANISVGQTRVMVVWTRAITPQHLDIALGSPSSNNLGEAGMSGTVDNHFWQTFGASALLSILGAASSSDVSANGTANTYQTSVSQGMVNTSSTLLQSRMNIKPTIRIPQGATIEVFVARDLDFSNLMTSSH